jgi:hypothetical protein
MPDYNPAVSLGVTAPDPNQGLNSLSKIMGLGQQGLSIQEQKQAIQANQQKLQQGAIATQAAHDSTDFFKAVPPDAYHDDSGLTSLEMAHKTPQYQSLSGAGKVAVDTQLNQFQTAGLSKQKALLGISAEARDIGSRAFMAASQDPTNAPAILAAAVKTNPDVGQYINTFQGEMQNAKDKAGAYRTIAKLGQSISENNPKTQNVDTGSQIEQQTVDPATGRPTTVSKLRKDIAPGTIGLPSGQVGTVGPGGQLTVAPVASGAPSGAPKTAADDRPIPNAPKAVQDAYMAATEQANKHVESIRTADESYGNNKAISNAVRTLSSDASTGPGTETWNHVMGVLGTKGANNYQELGAFLDRQAATVRGQMGLPGTNAGAEDAKMIAGNTKYNAKVIQDKNDYTEALTDGLHMYRNGLDRIAGFGGQASPSQVNKFKSAWTNAFDPNVLIGENAYKRSKAEGDKFVSSLAPKEAESLKAKRQAMMSLASGNVQ